LSTLTTDSNTSAQVNLSGAFATLEYGVPGLRFGVVGNVGHTHVTYLQVLQDTYFDSAALGLRANADIGPFVLTVGASGARNRYDSILQNSDDHWNGSEWEVHGSVTGHLYFAGPVWLAPVVGYRHLELRQDAHMIGSSIIPADVAPSDVLFGGLRVELDLRDQRQNIIKPWVFGGITHEFSDQAPMGPSVFLTEQIAGNHFTIFPQGTTGVPQVFPAKDTKVFGGGMDLDIGKVLSLRGAFFREFNPDFVTSNYRLGAVLRW
jgi:hypothetical protein